MRHPSLAVPLAAVLVAGAAAAGCGRCGSPRPPAASPARFLPADALATLVVPRLGEAARQAAALQGALLLRPGAGDLGTLRMALGAQLGVDLLDPASLAGAGLDPERGLALALLPAPRAEAGPRPVLVLPVAEAGRVQALVDRLARDRLGAGEVARQGQLVVWRLAPGAPEALSLAFADGAALLTPGPGGAEALGALQRLEPARALDQAPDWHRALAALGESPGALAFVPAGAPALRELLGWQGTAPPGALVAGLSASGHGARLLVAALLGGAEALLRPLARPGAGSAAPPAIAPDALVGLRLSADPGAAVELVADRLPPALLPWTAVAAAISPPVDVGLTLAPAASLGRALTGREADPFRLLRVELAAPLPAGSRAGEALAALAGAPVTPGPDGGWRARLQDGTDLAWSASGGRLHAVAVRPAPGAALEVRPSTPAGFSAPTPAGGQALAGGLGGLVVLGDNLVQALRALPPSAFGAGPDAVVARSLLLKLAALPGPGAALSLRVDLPEGALRLALELELGQPPGARP